MVYKKLPSATKYLARILLAARKCHLEDMVKTDTEDTVLLCATDLMIGRFLKLNQ